MSSCPVAKTETHGVTKDFYADSTYMSATEFVCLKLEFSGLLRD